MRALFSCFSISLWLNDLENIFFIEVCTNILFHILRICRLLFKCNYLKKKNLFLGLLFDLWNLQQLLNIFKKKKIVIANVFPKLRTVKDLVWPLSKKGRFRTSFDSQDVKGSQTLLKSAWENFYHIFSSLWGEIIEKKLPYWTLKS